MRIAYVEDNATNQALVERVARMTQHVIVPYSEGEIALDALRSESFDLIMMDIELAGKVNGLDVVRALRDTGLKTPIVAVTAYAMKGDRDRCLDAGCNDYLPKPIPIKDLLALLNRYDATFKAALAEAPHAAAPAPEAAAMTPAAATPAIAVTPPAEPVAEAAPPVAPAPAIPVTPPVPDAPAPVTSVVPVAAEALHAAPLLATAPVESGRPPDSAPASATPPATTKQTIEPAATPTTAPTTV